MKRILAIVLAGLYFTFGMLCPVNDLIVVAKSKKIPIAAGAPKYNPKKWNEEYSIMLYNCYAYAFNFFLNPLSNAPYDTVNIYGIQPGYFSCVSYNNQIIDEGISVKSVIKRVKTDMKCIGYKIKRIKKNNLYKKTNSKKQYLVYLQVTKNSKNKMVYNKKTKTAIKYHADYHWYRQDRNGKWSHKRGTWAVCNTDSKGKSINNPQKAKKNYETSLFPYIPGGPPYEMHNGILYSVKNVVEYNGNYGYYVITKK